MYMDDSSIKQLDRLKKGKDQQFAMIAKGSTIKRLMIFKRGSAQAQIMAAKKEGYKGDAYFVSGRCSPYRKPVIDVNSAGIIDGEYSQL